jgi:hypothetical protein
MDEKCLKESNIRLPLTTSYDTTTDDKEMGRKDKETVGKIKCKICDKASAQYTCPRCDLPYCDLKCYQDMRHMLCSEEFYKEQVLNELSMCKIDNTTAESRARIADILRRDAAAAASDNASSLDDLDVLSDRETDTDVASGSLDDIYTVKDEEEMLRVYENEIKNWQPWWRDTRQSLLVDELTPACLMELKINQTLCDNASEINVNQASAFMYNDILQAAYVYLMSTYIYQLSDDEFTDLSAFEFDSSLVEEICFAYLQVDKLLINNVAKTNDLKFRFNLIIVYLLQVESYFLKTYVNKTFLLNLLNDLIYFCKYPALMLKALSHIYDLFQSLIKRKLSLGTAGSGSVGNSAEKPLNVFHLHHSSSLSSAQKENINRAAATTTKTPGSDRKPTRVEILSKKGAPKICTASEDSTRKTSAEYLIEKVTRKDAKLMLKRIEFYFQWFQVNFAQLRNQTSVGKMCDELNSLKDVIQQEIQEFNANKQIINRNLDFIRKKISNKKSLLIEEL